MNSYTLRLCVSALKIFLIVSVVTAQSAVIIPMPGEKPDSKVLSLAVMNVDILIDNQHATVKIMQIIDNHTPRTLEGKYIFALQPRSSIADFAVWDNESRIPGVMMERRRANQIYGEIKQQQTDPGILQATDGEEADNDSTGFSVKIFPINPFGTKRLEMEYTEELPVEDLTSHFALPLRPSYGESLVAGEFNLRVRVLNEFPISPILPESAHYPLQVTVSGPNEFAAEFHAGNFDLKDDLLFGYRLDVGENSLSVISHRVPENISAYDLRDPRLADQNPDGYFEARALFAGNTSDETRPKRVVLLLDTSLSMYGDKLVRAVEAADFFLHRLTAADEFNLILFNEDALAFAPRLVAATPEAVEQAMQFVRNSSLGGGTNIKKALERAVEQAKNVFGGEASIVLISDGNPTLGTTETKSISAAIEKQHARLFGFALGADADQPVLKELAEKSHGYFDQARETEDISTRLGLLFAKVGTPNISNLKLYSPDSRNLYDIYPSGDNSYYGSGFSFVGRYRRAGIQKFTFSGNYGGAGITLSKDAYLPDLQAAHDYLPRIWAKMRIDMLLRAMNRDGEREDFIAEIIRLSEKYKIVTPYTAFLAAPRALLRPRLIQPGDPVIRVRTDPAVTEVYAVLPFGETLPLKYLADEAVWETRFLAPSWMADGTYQCRLLLTDKDGNGYQEEKSFVVDSRAPQVKINVEKRPYRTGEDVSLKVSADSDTNRLIARFYGTGPVQLRWSAKDKANVGTLRIPENLGSGRYTLSVSAEDFAHNQTTEETEIEVIGK